MSETHEGGWSLIVPVKRLRLAKTRLAPTVGDAARPALALAFAEDTVAAALACRAVREVLVVTDDTLAAERLVRRGARVVPDAPGGGLNAALARGAAVLRGRAPDADVAAMNADLPALRPAELAAVLAAAGRRPRSFLADTAAVGTTLLAARGGSDLAPAFGGPSRAAHLASGAAELTLDGVARVRRDVDTGDDLREALALGVGPRTAAAVRRAARLTASAGSGR
ncbi:2-phospho-L-lactate guanylyltransferase [Streptomyces sp. RFCAC02]|uniref:2-phospho-L-lactate guanylyltransferase n=1 Tax=Streptomyces sp. RFCAC02 TaxID=2499143 RepID=UPI001F0F16E3|nr:2-phospho-L-lactate guanylyltransferase [Streptomyces sp. RFCAC02]